MPTLPMLENGVAWNRVLEMWVPWRIAIRLRSTVDPAARSG